MIALMSARQSEKIAVVWIPDWSMISILFRRASDSAIRGEVTDSTIWAPDWTRRGRSLFKIQATPARFDQSVCVGAALSGRWLLFCSFSTSWAWSHSKAADSPLVAISAGRLLLSSKISLFLAVQRNQQTQGRIGDRIPVGGEDRLLVRSEVVPIWNQCPQLCELVTWEVYSSRLL